MRTASASTMANPSPHQISCQGFGIASLDTALGGGLARGRVHEVFAIDGEDAASAAGFAMAVTASMVEAGRTVLWLRTQRATRASGVMQANGWAELGAAPENGLLSEVPDARSLLRAAVDALRCKALGAVIVESWGTMRELDLTASRRLTLAAEKSGVPLFLLRMDTKPMPSSAQTRWQVSAAPSRALPGNAPGVPVFDVTLLRQRSGPCGLDWRLEWDRDQRMFREVSLSGAVVPLSARGSAADTGGDNRRAA